MDTVYFTICSANYLHYARTLHKSLVDNAKAPPFVLFLCDSVDGRFDVNALGFDCVEITDIGCDHVFDMAARYSIMEMNTAIKPFCFKWLFENRKESKVVFLDPDIFVLSEMAELNDALDHGANVVVTPHSLAPLIDGKDPDDIRLMRTGCYNLGFCALRRSEEASSLLDWWGKQLLENCVVDMANGLFVDQKFFDLVPSYFEHVHILRHPGYNVAYWNLSHRKVVLDFASGRWEVNDQPLRFFHFSGVVPDDSMIFSKHQDRFTVHNIGDVRILLSSYLNSLSEHSSLQDVNVTQLGYAYGILSNGLRFTDDMRRVYGSLFSPAPRSYNEAFSADIGRFLTFHPKYAHHLSGQITRLIYSIWESRADVRETFPIAQASGREGLVSWFLASAEREHRVPPIIIEATRALYDSSSHDSTSSGLVPGSAFIPVRDDLSVNQSWVGRRPMSREDAPGIGIVGYMRAESGLGSAARQDVRALRHVGASVSAYYMPAPGFNDAVATEFEISASSPREDCLVLHVNADSVGLVASHFDPSVLRRKHKIGYWAWELSEMPIEWLPAYDKVDEIWAPSTFSAEAFAQRTDKPVHVMPHPIDVPEVPLDLSIRRRRLDISPNRFVFLTAFDLNSYIDRKNPEAAIESFNKAFEATSGSPLLIVKLHGKFHRTGRYAKLLDAIEQNPNIVLIDRVMAPDEISDLQWSCDAFISLHRSEGFGMWIAECMARQKPCIVTNYSGNTDFSNDENSIPISFRMIEVQKGQYPFGEGKWWADPNIDEAIAAMRQLNSEPEIGTRLGLAARAHIAKHLAIEKVGQRMKERTYQARAEMLALPPILLQNGS